MTKKQKPKRQVAAAWLESYYTRLIIAQTEDRQNTGLPASIIPDIPKEETKVLFRRKLRWTILSCALCRRENGEIYVDMYVLSSGKERVKLTDIADYGTKLIEKACYEATQSHVIQSGYVAYLGNYEMSGQRLLDVFDLLGGFNQKANWEREFPINYCLADEISEELEEL